MNTQEEEKPSKTRQWQERSERPVATRPMTPAEILAFRQLLADSYKCDVKFIDFEFEKIQDEKDTDRDDCLWLIYKMQCTGTSGKRDIFRMKLPIPEDVRKAGEAERRRRANQNRKPRALLPAEAPTNTEALTNTVAPTTPVVPTSTEAPITPVVPITPVAPTSMTATAPAPRVKRPVRRK